MTTTYCFLVGCAIHHTACYPTPEDHSAAALSCVVHLSVRCFLAVQWQVIVVAINQPHVHDTICCQMSACN